MSTATTDRAPVGAGEIEIVRLGSGTRVGYLHGILGNPGAHPFLEELATDHEVVAPNLPGFGGSDPVTPPSFLDWIFLTSETVDAAGMAGGPVVAASVGGMLALELAALRPEAFSALVLVDPLGLWAAEEPTANVWAERTKHQLGVLSTSPGAIEAFLAPSEDLDVEELTEHELARYRTRRAAASLMWPLPDHGLSERIHRVRCPVHLIWGDEDGLIPVSYAQRFARHLPTCAGITTVPGAGHLAEWDRPAEVAAAVRRAIG